MDKLLENITLETLPDAIRQSNIKPGQPFSILIGDSRAAPQKLGDIAAQMRETAIAKGLTTEIFDEIMRHPE